MSTIGDDIDSAYRGCAGCGSVLAMIFCAGVCLLALVFAFGLAIM